jgi:hypothetical protein
MRVSCSSDTCNFTVRIVALIDLSHGNSAGRKVKADSHYLSAHSEILDCFHPFLLNQPARSPLSVSTTLLLQRTEKTFK